MSKRHVVDVQQIPGIDLDYRPAQLLLGARYECSTTVRYLWRGAPQTVSRAHRSRRHRR